jgi:hypothetical protein
MRAEISERTAIESDILSAGNLYEFDPSFDRLDYWDRFNKSEARWLGRYSIAQRVSILLDVAV